MAVELLGGSGAQTGRHEVTGGKLSVGIVAGLMGGVERWLNSDTVRGVMVATEDMFGR